MKVVMIALSFTEFLQWIEAENKQAPFYTANNGKLAVRVCYN